VARTKLRVLIFRISSGWADRALRRKGERGLVRNANISIPRAPDGKT
jgi:hypothetical protein